MLLGENKRFRVKLAENDAEKELALQLRYQVFRAERGLPAAAGELDRDEYDREYRHLLVTLRDSGRCIGTCRVGIPETLAPGTGLYSRREFRISGLEAIRGAALEVGRSCIDREFRSGAAVILLWSGLAELCRRWRRSFLFGCVSFPENEARLASAFHEAEKRGGRLSPVLTAEPLPEFRLPPGSAAPEKEQEAENGFRDLPPLVKGYLRLGSQICSPPAWDREFGSIDFLICCNLKQMTGKYAHHFHC